MTRKSILSVVIMITAMSTLFAQTKSEVSCTVKGLMVDSVSTETIPYVTVSVSAVAAPDVYFKRIAGSSNGTFELTLNKIGEYILSLESVGMQKIKQKITVAEGTKKLDMGKILMSVQKLQLKEVTVTATKPLVKVDLDKISYDIKSDPEAQSATTLDMLRKVPMVTVDGNDNVQLKGSTNFKIYINGKPSGMMATNPSQALKSIPASSVKSIEVITEPGAKYDAEGIGGIINIVTDRSLKGMTGTVRAGVDTRGSYNGGLYLSTKTGKFGLTANLNYNLQNSPQSNSASERENLNPQSIKYILQNSNSNPSYSYGYGNIEASYEIDTLNLLSLNLNGYLGGNNSFSNGHTYMLTQNKDTVSGFNQGVNSSGNWGGVDLSLDYQRTFKKPDQLFTVSYRLSRTPDSSDNITELYGIKNYANSKQHISSQAKGDEHTFQADYTEPFNKKHVVEMGLKYIIRLNNSENKYEQFNYQTNEWEPMINSGQSNLNQKQYIFGAYGSYTLKLEKFSIRVGARLESTQSVLELSDTTLKFPFFNLVPSISTSYKINPESNLRLTYNQRISRPGIWYLNPFRDNSNPNSITQGNPDLVPEINNSFSLNYNNTTPKLNMNASLYTSFTNNSIERISNYLSDTVVYNTFKNIGLSENTGISLYGSWQADKNIKLNLNGNIEYIYLATNDGSGLKNSGFNYNFSFGSQVTLPLDIKWNVNAGYYSRRISLQGTDNDYLYYSTTLSREFLNKNLNVSFRASNFINKTINFRGFINTADYNFTSNYSMIGRNFGITISYKFGKMEEQIKKVQKTIENDDVKGGGSQGGGK